MDIAMKNGKRFVINISKIKFIMVDFKQQIEDVLIGSIRFIEGEWNDDTYKFVFDTGTEMTSNSDEFEIVIDDEESFEFYFDGVRDRGITTLEELEEWVIQADE